MDAVPAFDAGWLVGAPEPTPYLTYAGATPVNWSDELEVLHEESSRTHFMDVWTRHAILERVGASARPAAVADIGCSTGYLLHDLREAYPEATLIGIDLVAAGLRKAHGLVPSARLVLADACDLPLHDGSVDTVVTANLLEHVPDDGRALEELRRVLAPDGHAVIVVPAGPGTYDYYDRFLGHVRRYGRRELARRATAAGLDVIEDRYIASLLFPAFWLVKRWHRLRYAQLDGPALAQRVAHDIASTAESRVGELLGRLERRLGLRLPFGIRNLVWARRRGR
jgi:SAM-dependent methyltransferase